MLQEFKKFALRGNVIDMAVGIIIGAAFSKIVNSLVKDVIMPPVGMLMGKLDFTEYAYTLRPATEQAEAITINYGLFTSTVLDFVILAFCIFLMVKAMNNLKQKEEVKVEAVETVKKIDCPHCCTPIPNLATRCPYCTSELGPHPAS